MIRKISQNNTTLRTISTSQENNKVKKSTSTSSKNKINISSMCNTTTSSIKKNNRIDNSKSNKKTGLLNSSSNKSLKGLRENTHFRQVETAKKKDKENREIKEEEKKGTIMVKNIKNKILGNNQPFPSKNNAQMTKKPSSKVQYRGIPANNTITTPRNKNINKSMNNMNQMNNRESTNTVTIENLTMDMFEVGRKLGKGRFGDVYMARQIKTGFALAMKVISKKQLKQSEMQAQLVQEIKVQMYSNHPNILKMYGFFADQNKIYLLLELATNGCLFRQIRQKAYFEEDLACYYFRQVTSGIRYLHSHSIIHRDIKPENILNCFNVLKICDFGWAIYSPIYQRQTFCGTLDYVPPEIVTGDFYDEKVDVWCLGVLCYELCTGKAPFESKTDENETYDKILKVQIQFPLYMSPQIVDFIGRILNRQPQKRINLQQIESHEWMRGYENESGRMISKQIWDSWMKLNK